MTRIFDVTETPVDVFAGFGSANVPGLDYAVQNIGGETIRHAVTSAPPTDLTAGFRLFSGERDTFTVPPSGESFWIWCAVGRSARLGLEF